MAIVRVNDWVEIFTTRFNSSKINLKGQVYQVSALDFQTGELVVDTGDIMGQIKLLNTEVKLAIPPKVPASKKPFATPDQIKTSIKNLVVKYQAGGDRVDINFLEQILGKDVLEQILSNPDISKKNSYCSKKPGGSICSKNIDDLGANTTEPLPQNQGGKPPGRKNTKPASGWLDKYQSKTTGAITWYFCRDEYLRRVKKTKISNGQKQVVEQMIKSGYSASQIEDLVEEGVLF